MQRQSAGQSGESPDSRMTALVAIATATGIGNQDVVHRTIRDAIAAGASQEEILDVVTAATRFVQGINLENIFEQLQGAELAAPPRAATRRRGARAAAAPSAAPQSDPAATEAPPASTGAAPRRRGRPPGSRNVVRRETAAPPAPDAVVAVSAFANRDDFWDALTTRFQEKMPDARLSRTAGPRERAVRMGRGKINLNWAFRRRGNFAVQLILDNEGVDSPNLDGIRQSVEDYIGQSAVLEGKGANRSTVALYSPQREKDMTADSVEWGAETMNRLYDVLRSIEGRRRRRGRRRRQPSEGTPAGQLLSNLGSYIETASAGE